MSIKKKISIVIFSVLLLITGKFFISVYAAEFYCNRFNNKESNENREINQLNIGTYNIKSMNYGESIEKFREDIQELDLDIISLQEVDRNALRSGNSDMIKDLANVSGYQYYYFFPTMWILDGYYGIGILSKYPINEVSSELLPNSILKEPRILINIKIKVGNRIVNIYNTHVTYEDNEYRIRQLKYIQEHIQLDEFTILTGDFNTFGSNGRLQLDNMNGINNNQEYLTFRNFASPDNIYYSNDFTMLESGIKTSSFSDHNVLYAKFQFNK